MLQQGILVDDTMSNLTSVTSNEASISSRNKVADHDNHPSANFQQPHYQQNNDPIFASPSNDLALQPPANKKKRSLPGNPDPEAEVVALSPKSLMATNRFLCEICNKGFQRDQNLQLHRRGHNLPWKLKQRSKTEVVKKKVYICPEPSCVHHEPSRALGDLTGIKKHFSRKHGEKKFKCEKCSKRYAVHSDWKAHSKICGTREYRCDCGTLFSRRDSFITHRAFCDALAEESSRSMTQQQNSLFAAAQNQNMKPHQPYHQILFHDNTQKQEITTHNNFNHLLPPWLSTSDPVVSASPNQRNNPLLISSCAQKLEHQPFVQENPNNNNIINTGNNMIFSTTPNTPSLMSATALLRKAAQMGVTTMNANNTLNRSSGVIDQSPSPAYHHVGRFISSSAVPSSDNITAGGLSSSSSREAFLHGLASLGNEVVGGCMMQLHHPDASVNDVSCVVGNHSLPSSVFEDGFDGILNPNGNGNNSNEGLTRDFLGLRAFPNDHRDFINVVNLDQLGSSSSSFDHHLQSSTDQDQAPWQS